jgi:hypothetical protein
MFTSNQLTIDKSKWLPYAVAIVATAVVVYQSTKQPTVYEKTEVKVVTKTVDKVVYKDRVKVVRQIITKPDGTKIETDTRDETKSGSHTKEKEKKKSETSVVIRRLPSYSLSIHCDIRSCNSFQSYQTMVGFRLGQLPFNLELGGGLKGVLIGVRYDF